MSVGGRGEGKACATFRLVQVPHKEVRLESMTVPLRMVAAARIDGCHTRVQPQRRQCNHDEMATAPPGSRPTSLTVTTPERASQGNGVVPGGPRNLTGNLEGNRCTTQGQARSSRSRLDVGAGLGQPRRNPI